jgi:LuxR family transcriptional regulator
MANQHGKVEAVARHLSRLGTLCDTGFALAIHIRLTAPTLLYQTYAQDWADHYSIKGYMLFDPVVHWGLTNTGRVVWDTLTDADPEGVIAAAVSFGLTHGWTYAVGPSSSRTIAGLTRSDRAHTIEEVAEIQAIVDDLHAITEGFDDLPKDVQDKLRRL